MFLEGMGSILPQLAAFTAALSNDDRYAVRMSAAAAAYVDLLQSYANNNSYLFPLLNVTSINDNYNVGFAGLAVVEPR